MHTDDVVDRFLQYVKFDTQSDELTNLTPQHPARWCLPAICAKSLRL